MTIVVYTSVIFVTIGSLLCTADAATTCPASGVSYRAAVFVDRIFAKYGKNNNVIKKDGFKLLIQTLNLGNVTVKCQKNDTVCLKNKLQMHLPKRPVLTDPLQLKSTRIKRATLKQQKKAHAREWSQHLKQCMSYTTILKLYNISDSTGITKKDFLQICPALIQQIDNATCIHYHKKFVKPVLILRDGPTKAQTWGYGFLAITIVSLLSLTVIAMIPCLKKSFYNMMMAYLVALAVGTLAGDALLHLIPHAFIEGANLAANIQVSKEDRLKQHYSQVWRATFVLLGIYLFFLVEQLMKFKGACCGTEHGHSHQVPMTDVTESPGAADEHHEESSVVHVDESHGHGHSHGDKQITAQTKISSVAWMVIVGDGFHNFSDGLAVGAAFSASMSSGVSTTIAIFCHELPHELGDFAILLKAGMTIRQAIVYNLVSAVLSYVGLVVGIFAGEGDLGRHIILSITAGLFLYISLADMMGELTDTESGIQSKRATFICQHLGLLSGIGIMLFISLYEDKM